MNCNNEYVFDIPSSVASALKRLNEHGFEAYCVGGCVRDYIMGVVPHDFDITTSALPNEVCQCFKDCRVIETGIQHGTVTVVLDGEMLEITTFRTDGTYSDGRHPDSVSFTRSLTDDLSRRDFTVNAMAYNPEVGVVDPFGGREHIKEKIICCVGDAGTRFSEDALRIMRALRFSAVLGFDIAESTAHAIFRKTPMLDKISTERIYAELTKLVCGKNAEKILLDFSSVICRIIPELTDCVGFEQKTKYHKYDVYTHIIKTLSSCDSILTVRLAALLHDVAKPDCFTVDNRGVGHSFDHQEKSARAAKAILRRLHSDNKTIATVTALIQRHDDRMIPDRIWVKHLISETSFEFVKLLMELKKGDILAHSDGYNDPEVTYKILDIVNCLEKENCCLFTKDLAVSGKELSEIGVPKGKIMGEILNKLLNLVINEKLENTPDALLEKAKELIK
ncbi:MAG: HD domain-containing protein [Ruminococcaceae bacterium]|nr:HD domain-containing protein [Oscillospiraceae bacterium]